MKLFNLVTIIEGLKMQENQKRSHSKFPTPEDDARSAVEFIAEVAEGFAQCYAPKNVNGEEFTVCASLGTASMGAFFFPTVELGLRAEKNTFNPNSFSRAISCLHESMNKILASRTETRYATLAVRCFNHPVK